MKVLDTFLHRVLINLAAYCDGEKIFSDLQSTSGWAAVAVFFCWEYKSVSLLTECLKQQIQTIAQTKYFGARAAVLDGKGTSYEDGRGW